MSENLHQHIKRLYRQHSGQMLAYLCSIFSDIDFAEEIWHEIIAECFDKWQNGLPDKPTAWLKTAARNKAIDKLRHQQMSLQKAGLIKSLLSESDGSTLQEVDFADEQLKLIFCCCHPALELDKQVPLTLNIICGLKTHEIAAALLVNVKSLEQRLTRTKNKIKQAGIPFSIPEPKELPHRLNGVLKTIYLLFNHGVNYPNDEYNLQDAAIRLTQLMNRMLPHHAELNGLLALMMFHRARSAARFDEAGNFIPLSLQDRTLWNTELIENADKLLQQTMKQQQIGSYQLQAAIQGLHCLAPTAETTDWQQIEGLYGLLVRIEPSPVIELNAAVAAIMAGHLLRAKELIERLSKVNEIQQYSAFYVAKAELFLKLENIPDSILNFEKAIALCQVMHEKNYLNSKLDSLKNSLSH